MDISYCGDKTGFPRPGHICASIPKKSPKIRDGSGNQKLVRPIAAPNPFQKEMHKNIRINCLSLMNVTDYITYKLKCSKILAI